MRITRATWVRLFLVCTGVAIFNLAHYALDDYTRGLFTELPRRTIEEFSGVYSSFLLLPAVLWLMRRYPFGPPWGRFVAIHFCGAFAYSTLHTTLMWLSREALFPLFGLGGYDYGNMLYRYPMEGARDVLDYAIIFTVYQLLSANAAIQRAQLLAAELEAKLAEATLENLRLQLQPHFLFNTLNAISSVMYEDVGKADKMLSQVSDFMRTILSSGGVHTVEIGEELRIEAMYVDIMRTRLEKSLALTLNVDPGAESAHVPFMLLQPLLENSIRHGMGSARGSIDLQIDVQRRNGSTVIAVSDNGVGYGDGAPWGIGLSNTAARLQHLYGERASFEIAPAGGGGTRATVVIPTLERVS